MTVSRRSGTLSWRNCLPPDAYWTKKVGCVFRTKKKNRRRGAIAQLVASLIATSVSDGRFLADEMPLKPELEFSFVDIATWLEELAAVLRAASVTR